MDGVHLYRLHDRVAVVTGAAGGIGREVATHLAALGATVVLADRLPAVAETAAAIAASGATADSIAFDVTDSAAVDAACAAVLARHGRIDILVANAGIAYESPTVDHTDADWRRVMDVNLDGVFYCVRAFGRAMVRRRAGAIVATSSIAAVKAVRPELHIGYDVSKAGVAHLCRVLAVEWAKFNVRVNAIGPGYTDTELLAEVGRARPEVMKVWLDDMPVHRLMESREIAGAVGFLVSDAASGVTGQLLMVDGGYSVA
jgi:NAD(P)-dependent dehydrogenase (short-subunit alcohol dehydrogenase family)